MHKILTKTPLALAMASLVLTAPSALASSHREAPFIAGSPKVDGTDFYMFRSYETNRSDFVTLIANYQPLQDAYGGPNYFLLDDNAIYEIHIDNDGDAVEDLTFQFQFNNEYKNLAVPAGADSDTPVPLSNIGPISAGNTGALNVEQTYSVKMISGDRRTGEAQAITNANSSSETFVKPMDNIGNKSIPDYPAYASDAIYPISIPGCATDGKVFVGQRKEGFVVNLGEVFDLVNTNPVGPRDGERNVIGDKNVTSLALEIPRSCLTAGESPVIGGWTTASVPQARVINPAPQGSSVTGSANAQAASVEGGAFTQVSRLGSPLVNEVVIGLPDKNRFNASEPKDDGQFAQYVTNPSLPVLLNVLFGDAAVPPETPRNDLVTAFLTGFPGVNQLPTVTPSEMLRLNTDIAPTAPAQQNDLGVVGGDNAGFPNGRRPYDDVVDVALNAAMGKICGQLGAGNCGSQSTPQNGSNFYTDGTRAAGPTAATSVISGQIDNDDTYLAEFPYLANPVPGSPSDAL
ncbi:MAG: DUF4331 domain-containing protein [Alcanivorax sp.]|nr:DUF4331 domain-containing protein [Alcanivorax sp.]